VTDDEKPRARLRADARRNQEQLLAAARDVVVERGIDAPLEEVARRAGVGIATLYRRFPDRSALLRAVVLDALERTSVAAEEALDGAADGFTALVRYLHAALDVRASAVIPLVLGRLDLEDPELGPARERTAALVQRLVEAAHADSTLAADVTFADVGTLLVRFARPLPGLPPDVDDRLAHRHLDLLVAGLRPVPGREPPRGPQLDRAALRALRPGEAPSDADRTA